MATLETNLVQPSTGTTLTLGAASDVIQIPASAEIDIASGATLDVNGTLDVTGATVTGLSAGKVLQVVSASCSTELSTDTDPFIDLGLSASITPSATSSKVFALWIIQFGLDDDCGFYQKLLRDATAVYTAADNRDIYANQSGSETQRIDMRAPTMYLDSPSTTSATTYKIQISTYSTSTVDFQQNDNISQLILMEIGA